MAGAVTMLLAAPLAVPVAVPIAMSGRARGCRRFDGSACSVGFVAVVMGVVCVHISSQECSTAG
jgi:hypothetical protein